MHLLMPGKMKFAADDADARGFFRMEVIFSVKNPWESVISASSAESQIIYEARWNKSH